MVAALYLFFLAVIILVRIDFSITHDKAVVAKQQVPWQPILMSNLTLGRPLVIIVCVIWMDTETSSLIMSF